jgi:hypothetical protein
MSRQHRSKKGETVIVEEDYAFEVEMVLDVRRAKDGKREFLVQ